MPDIIIVEDNKEIGTLLCDFLRKENYRVSLADTGGKGIIDIPENDEECEWLAKQNFKNSVDDAYTGEYKLWQELLYFKIKIKEA